MNVATDIYACLTTASIDLTQIASSGGGVWLFGSRAAGCARRDSDWDLLIICNSARIPRRVKHHGIDINYLPSAHVETWSKSELGTHVSEYGIRLDGGRALWTKKRADLAASRKQALVAIRSEQLNMVQPLLRPGQLQAELLRLRRNAQRGWLLSLNTPVPPTAMLDDAWQSSNISLQTSILEACGVARTIAALIVSA